MTAGTAEPGPVPRKSRWRREPAPCAQPLGAAELEGWIAAWLARRLRLDPADLDRDTPFTDYGIDSLLAVQLSGELERKLARPVDAAIGWEFPTLAELSTHLAGEIAAAADAQPSR